MKLPRFTKALIAVGLLLILFICLTPSKKALSSTVGLWGPRILWNRIRDFGAIPLSCGVWLLAAGSAYLSGIRKRERKGPVRRAFFVGFLVLTIAGIYWTVAAVCMVKLPLMPGKFGLLLMTHSGWFCLWWAVAAALLLCALYLGTTGPKLPEKE